MRLLARVTQHVLLQIPRLGGAEPAHRAEMRLRLILRNRKRQLLRMRHHLVFPPEVRLSERFIAVITRVRSRVFPLVCVKVSLRVKLHPADRALKQFHLRVLPHAVLLQLHFTRKRLLAKLTFINDFGRVRFFVFSFAEAVLELGSADAAGVLELRVHLFVFVEGLTKTEESAALVAGEERAAGGAVDVLEHHNRHKKTISVSRKNSILVNDIIAYTNSMYIC